MAGLSTTIRYAQKEPEMLYLGYFSFDEFEEDKLRHGYFTCIVESDGPERATDQFRQYITDIKNANGESPFKNVAIVYLEDIIEITAPPRQVTVTYFQSAEGEFPDSTTYSLPFADDENIRAFGLQTNVSKNEDETSDAYIEEEPFIEF